MATEWRLFGLTPLFQTTARAASAVARSSSRTPLAWRVETARSHESNYVAPLLDAARARGFRPITCAMDMGYDNNRVYAECDERGCVAVIPLRKGQGERNLRIPRSSDEWRNLYRRRYGLAFLRVRGSERVRLHADLVMLGRLAQALSRARAVRLDV